MQPVRRVGGGSGSSWEYILSTHSKPSALSPKPPAAGPDLGLSDTPWLGTEIPEAAPQRSAVAWLTTFLSTAQGLNLKGLYAISTSNTPRPKSLVNSNKMRQGHGCLEGKPRRLRQCGTLRTTWICDFVSGLTIGKI